MMKMVDSYIVHIQMSNMSFTIRTTEHLCSFFTSHINATWRQPIHHKYKIIEK